MSIYLSCLPCISSSNSPHLSLFTGFFALVFLDPEFLPHQADAGLVLVADRNDLGFGEFHQDGEMDHLGNPADPDDADAYFFPDLSNRE